MVGLCWLLVVFRSFAEDNFIVAQSTMKILIGLHGDINSTISPEWVPVERYWMKVNIRIVPLSQVGTASVKTPYWQF